MNPLPLILSILAVVFVVTVIFTWDEPPKTEVHNARCEGTTMEYELWHWEDGSGWVDVKMPRTEENHPKCVELSNINPEL